MRLPLERPTILVGLGSGREAWLSFEPDSLRFTLEIEGRRPTVETLDLPELKARFPSIVDHVADVLADAVRSCPVRSHRSHEGASDTPNAGRPPGWASPTASDDSRCHHQPRKVSKDGF
jgi:hypothetical protein